MTKRKPDACGWQFSSDRTILGCCTREDGSVTWQKQEKHSAFFAMHDLTHYAVRTALKYHRGFFGLIASGWDIEDTTGKGSPGELPPKFVGVPAFADKEES
ncbi:MAG: hypothetical protein JO166_03550 [Deltaproteobacteria bacterium]|nr:hypothetical protein [Deltaproteobacteria bacterium]